MAFFIGFYLVLLDAAAVTLVGGSRFEVWFADDAATLFELMG